jgi:uncharacterized protein YndB with AHSA1/START domain
MQIAPMADSVNLETEINASQIKVWDALTNPKQMRQWYFGMLADFRAIAGFTTRFTVSHNDKDFIHVWTVTHCIANRVIAYQWHYEGYPGLTEVTFSLSTRHNKTLVTLNHSGLLSFIPEQHPELSAENFRQGWTYFLDALKHFLEHK